MRYFASLPAGEGMDDGTERLGWIAHCGKAADSEHGWMGKARRRRRRAAGVGLLLWRSSLFCIRGARSLPRLLLSSASALLAAGAGAATAPAALR